jgi:acetyl-CoA carboxylase biotin carboxyl carrier protein
MKPSRKKAESPTEARSRIDWVELNRVLDFMGQHNLEEFEYSSGDLRVHLRNRGARGGGLVPMAMPAAIPAAEPSRPAAPAVAAVLPAAAEPAPDEGLHLVKSPIVGTFYGSPNPTSAPFVKTGDKVKAGQVLCIVEAMKLMNEVESDVTGELVRVLAENGQPVEYGQPLFAIRTA